MSVHALARCATHFATAVTVDCTLRRLERATLSTKKFVTLSGRDHTHLPSTSPPSTLLRRRALSHLVRVYLLDVDSTIDCSAQPRANIIHFGHSLSLLFCVFFLSFFFSRSFSLTNSSHQHTPRFPCAWHTLHRRCVSLDVLSWHSKAYPIDPTQFGECPSQPSLPR